MPVVPNHIEQQVYSWIREGVTSGLIPPGQALVEARIAEELGTSKTPVREALIRLQRDGLVEIKPYRGARVVLPAPQDVREVLEVRLSIESYIASRLAETQPTSVMIALGASIQRTRDALADPESASVVTNLREFSTILSRSCGNARMVKILDDLRGILAIIGNASRLAPHRAERSIEEHTAILDAIRQGNVAKAVEATEAHIRGLEQDSIAAVEKMTLETA